MKPLLRTAGIVALCVALANCADALRWRHYDYVVQAGDTLYSIAWRYNLDYRELADWNNIHSPYTIYVGEHLVLSRSMAVRYGAPTHQPAPAAGNSVASAPTATASASDNVAIVDNRAVTWQWPAVGTVLSGYDPDKVDAKGINISGSLGEDVHAAAAGRVVYSGSGLIGYGQLIIIKHNDHYLSAYAHNSERFVREGDTVSAGEKIATMGKADGKPVLHFEIRYDGKPVDPLDYLPRRK